MVRTFKGGFAVALIFGAMAAQAAGLGKLTVNSALGQPLNAEIDLVSLQPGEVDALTARVSPIEAYRDARIEYVPSLRLLRFSTEKRANGQPYLKVTSIGPINEPFVDVLIEVSWAQGRVQREYPILLDPPGYAAGRVTAPAAAATPPPTATARVDSTPPAATPAATPSADGSSAPVTSGAGSPSASSEMPRQAGDAGSSAGSDTYGPVQKGETLRKIAEQVKPSDVSMEQMLVSLYRQNQAAFIGNNMNRLRTGQILKVPTAEEIGSIQQKEANREIRTHVADWKAYREQLAGGVTSMPARPETSNVASGRVSSAAVTPPPAPPSESKDVLKLSRSDAGGKAGATSSKGGGGSADRDRLNALQEELTAKDKALRESQSRVSDLEKQIRDMQRLMDLKAGAPTKPGDTKTAAATPPTPAKVEPAKVEPAKPAEPAKVAEAPKTEPAKPAEPPKPSEPVKTAEAPKPAEPKKAEAPKTQPKAAPKKAEPDLLDQLADNWIYIAGGILALGAVLFGVFAFVRRRKAGAEAGPSSAMTSAFPSDLKAPTGPGKAGGGLVDTGNSSFLTDFDKTGPGAIDTDEVDPVAEAEVYIAYGRDSQAEEILKEAMAREKNRPEVALKLLEIYHARKSPTAFENVAKELHGMVDEGSPQWQKAAAMGHQIDPANSLYAAAAGATYTPEAPAAKPDVDFAADTGSGNAPATDFDLDSPSSSGATMPDLPAEPAHTMDFNLEGSSTPSAPVDVTAAHEAPKEEKSSFDFDLSGLDFPGSKPAGGGAASAASSGGSDMNLTDLSLDSPGGGGGDEAVGTKLELAKAYLEIGDKDGARDILNEVAKEGSAAQQEEAKKLISSL